MLVIQPMMSRTNPRISTLPAPTPHLHAECAEALSRPDPARSDAEVSTQVRPWRLAFPTDPESNRSAWSRPEDPLSQDATTVRHTARSTRTCQMGRLVVSVQGLPVECG
jgi:hypothetical protein